MTTISDTFINALLADSSYVDGLTPNMTGDNLGLKLAGRMTPELAKYISDNFSVVKQVGGLASSFDATVWRGNAGTPFDGQVYVSMRGTQEGADFTADADLASSGLAHQQLADMVNWWLRETTPPNTLAHQVKWDPLNQPNPPSIVIVPAFVADTDVLGSGGLLNIGSIKSVNGHSLGGYLASAFVRLFGTQWPVDAINTFNSAGFSKLQATSIESGFNQIAQVIGTGLGLGHFSDAQNNYFAQNGINVTTNTWDPVGFKQYGTRIGMFQEDLTPQGINNHYMYKLTDFLALGNALAKLDPSQDLTKLSTLGSAGSNQMAASYEGVLDSVRRLLLGANVTSTQTGDANANNTGPQPAPRLDYQTNLKAFTDSAAFQSLQGKVTLSLATDAGLATKAKTDFAAAVALTVLSPITVTANGANGQAALDALWQTSAWNSTYQDWLSDYAARQSGGVAMNFTDNWLTDRSALLNAIVTRNQTDSSSSILTNASAPSDRALQFQWYGADPLPGEILLSLTAVMEPPMFGVMEPRTGS